MKILVFGDLFGRPGLAAVKEALPDLRASVQPELVIANAENLSNGKGVTAALLDEVFGLGVDVATSGDHTWDDRSALPRFDSDRARLLRPANFPPGAPGAGWTTVTRGITTIAIANLIGRVFFRQQYDDPFRAAEAWLASLPTSRPLVTLVDFHAEASSEKRAMGFFLDGRVTAVWGTHTHVPTADEQLLPKGTAYLSDVGMTGSLRSIIGLPVAPMLESYRTQMNINAKPEDARPWEVNAVVLDIDETTGKARGIERIRKILT